MTQKLAGIVHEPLFQVFLDMRNAYDYLDRGWCMDTLRGYGTVQNMAYRTSHHWDSLLFVPKASRLLGVAFNTGIGVTQGDPASPMIFNTVVDVVVRAVLEVVYGPQEARYGTGWAAGEHNLGFYADDWRISGRDHIWFQDALTVAVEMF